jgi:hypothetical protein
VDLIILHDADNIPQSPHRSLTCAEAVIIMACSSVWIQLRSLINTGHSNSIDDSKELLPTQSTIHKMVLALSLTLNYLTATTLKSPNTGGRYSSPCSFQKVSLHSYIRFCKPSMVPPRYFHLPAVYLELLLPKLCMFLPSQSNIPAATSSQDSLCYVSEVQKHSP